ncbi:peptidase MA family metallohydrolase [Chloroflexota bacterium]
MIKKTIILTLSALVFCLCLVMLSPGASRAGSEFTIIDNSTQIEFPTTINFHLSAESDINITDVRLLYTIKRLSYAQVTSEAYIEFMPDTNINVGWNLETVRIGGLPPGSSIEYQWLLEDANSKKTETAPLRIQFVDSRYPWRSLSEGIITIYWYNGDEFFAQELMTAAQQALGRLNEDTGAYLEKPAQIYTYASAQDFRGSMIYPREWTGGAAYTRYGIITIGISPNTLTWGKTAIAHEFTHLVIHQMTLNPYSELPVWLDEGLAMYTEGLLGPQFTNILNQAITKGSLISVQSLSSPFSAHTEHSILSYAQSYSLVEYLLSNYGRGMMLELLNTFSQGSTYDGALEKVYGFNTDGLDTLWQDYVSKRYQPVEIK